MMATADSFAWLRSPEPILGLDHLGVQARCLALYGQFPARESRTVLLAPFVSPFVARALAVLPAATGARARVPRAGINLARAARRAALRACHRMGRGNKGASGYGGADRYSPTVRPPRHQLRKLGGERFLGGCNLVGAEVGD